MGPCKSAPTSAPSSAPRALPAWLRPHCWRQPLPAAPAPPPRRGTGHSSCSAGPTRPSCCWASSTRSEEHTSELQSPCNLVCRLLLAKKNKFLPQPAAGRHKVRLPLRGTVLSRVFPPTLPGDRPPGSGIRRARSVLFHLPEHGHPAFH